MSSSVESSKIDLLDDEKTVNEKIKRAYCKEGEVEGNGVLAFFKNVVIVIKQDSNKKFIVERDEKFGGNLEFERYEDLEKMYANKELHPLDLKNALAKEVNNLLSIIRKNRKELEKLSKKAY